MNFFISMDGVFLVVCLILCEMINNMECWIVYSGEGNEPCKAYERFEKEPYEPCSNLTVSEKHCSQTCVDRCLACKGHFLMEAVIKQRNEKVERLLNTSDVGHMVTFKDRYIHTYGFTSLTWAASKNLTELAKLLLHHVTNVNIRSEKNYSPLYYFAKYENLELVDILLDKGAEPDAAPNGGDTPLLNAARSNCFAIAKSLLDNQADPNYLTPFSNYSSLYFASKSGNIDLVNELLNRNALVDPLTSWDITPLMIASSYGHKDIVATLLARDADPNLHDNLGYTALHKAAYYGYDAIITSLLEHNADINALDSENKTALHFSAVQGWVTSVSTLLRSCPDDTIEDADGQTALDETLIQVDKLNLNPYKTEEKMEKLDRLNNIVTQLQGYDYASCQ